MQKPFPIARWLWWLGAVVIVLQAIGPFAWLLSTALKGVDENLFSYPPQWLPQHPSLAAFATVWQKSEMPHYLLNSATVATLTTLLNLTTSTLMAYPLARWQFKGKRGFDLLAYLHMVLPFQLLMIPLHQLMLQLHLSESNGWLPLLLALCLPFSISGFGVLMVKQALEDFPDALEEAANMDGATPWQTFLHIVLPYLRPTLATLAIFCFLASWGEFLWPSILINSPKFMTLPLGLLQLQGQFSANWRIIAASTLLSLLPSLIFFLLMQRQLVNPNTDAALK